MHQVIPTAEPFFFPGAANKPGVLLIHGFTGTPKELRWLGQYLNQRLGLACLGIRLSGHATRPEDMIRSRYQDWLASVEDGYQILVGATNRVYLAGLSMGGALALTAAAWLPSQGVIAMSTPIGLPNDWRLRAIRLVALVHPFTRKGSEAPGAGWFDHNAWQQHVAYPRHPTRAFRELDELLGTMREGLPKVRVPVLLMHSRDDHYVLAGSMRGIYDRLGSREKQMVWIEGSGHVITEDAQRETVFTAAGGFIAGLETAFT